MKVPKAQQLKNGLWAIYLRLGGEEIPVKETTEAKCRHAAERIKAEWLSTKRLDILQAKTAYCTLDNAISEYIASKDGVLSPSTIRNYKIIQRCRFQTAAQANIYSADWQRIVNDESPLCSAKTLHNAWLLVSAAVYAKTGIRPAVTLPQIVRNERPYLTPEQIEIFVQAVKGDTVEIPALLGLCSLRQSEILGLQWKNVDLKRGMVRVSGAVVRDKTNKPVYKATNKNASSARTVPIMPQLAEALKKSGKHAPESFVVGLTDHGIYSRVNTICRRNDLPEIGVHGLRHSFASLAYSLNVPYKVAMKIGGWSDDTTMQKIYTHIGEKDIANSADKIMGFYNGKNANEKANVKNLSA